MKFDERHTHANATSYLREKGTHLNIRTTISDFAFWLLYHLALIVKGFKVFRFDYERPQFIISHIFCRILIMCPDQRHFCSRPRRSRLKRTVSNVRSKLPSAASESFLSGPSRGGLRRGIGSARYLHNQHILHRDIKPANILLTRTGCLPAETYPESIIGWR